MLVAFTGMVSAKISGNLMSLGAIDFGLIVDGSVVMIENIVRHISERREKSQHSGRMTAQEIHDVIRESGGEVLRPIFFAVGIIIIVYLPILTLEGIEGKIDNDNNSSFHVGGVYRDGVCQDLRKPDEFGGD